MSQNPNQPLPCPSFFLAQSAAYIRQNHESVGDTVLTERTSAQKPSRLRVFEIEFYETLVVRVQTFLQAQIGGAAAEHALSRLPQQVLSRGIYQAEYRGRIKSKQGGVDLIDHSLQKRRRLDGPDLLAGKHVGQSVYFERELPQCVLRDSIPGTKRIVFLAQRPDHVGESLEWPRGFLLKGQGRYPPREQFKADQRESRFESPRLDPHQHKAHQKTGE